MKKKLPAVFPGKVRSDAGNNIKMTYVNGEERKDTASVKVSGENVTQKINKIFNSKNYIYKADVVIKLKDGSTLNKRIVGKNNLHLITMDNELIPVTDIVDIERK